MNDDVFVAKGYEHIYASSGYRLNLAFCGCLYDVEARAYVLTASYAPELTSELYLHIPCTTKTVILLAINDWFHSSLSPWYNLLAMLVLHAICQSS